MTSQSRAIFTICSNNYMPLAAVLLRSARQQHPEAALYLCLADEPLPQADFYPPECRVVRADSLPIGDFRSFAFRYDIMEFNTALKPFMIRHLLALGHDAVVYLDPDIEVFAPLDAVFDLLDDGASFVLTPHLTGPAEHDTYPDDLAIMRAGVYNLGFLGVGAHPETDAILRWWSRRLQYDCVNDQPRGLFVDQKFMDLLPGFAGAARILRDHAYNVAYWNLQQRALSQQGSAWLIDERPLRFFHFSGVTPGDPSRLSRHTEAFRGAAVAPALAALLQHYGDAVQAHDYGRNPAALYAYGRFASGVPIPALVRQMFREWHGVWPHGDPFADYQEYLQLPSAQHFPSAAYSISNFMEYLLAHDPGLRAAYPAREAGSAQRYAAWFLGHARELGIDRRLIEPAAIRAGRHRLQDMPRHAPAKRESGEADVCVIGYLRLAMGVAEAGRQTLAALCRTPRTVRALPLTLNAKSPTVDRSPLEPLFDTSASARVHVFNVNADQISIVTDHLRPVLRSDAYRVIVPFWELEDFPDELVPEFDSIDEVWAPTRYIQAMLCRQIAKPVLHMPLPLNFAAPPPGTRAALGLPDHTFLFFFAFDFLSFVERKNPLALLRAFRLAFGTAVGPGKVALVLKTLNGDIRGEHSRSMHAMLRNEPGVILIDHALDRTTMLQLIDACDAVASLHRSEGLGLLVAEAMALGKPVVATDYSATTELVSEDTGWPVDFRLVPVNAGEYPFHEGKVWAAADEQHAAWQLRQVRDNPQEASRRSVNARKLVHEHFAVDACAARMQARLVAIDGA